jgi:hypothetical protein
LDSRSLITLLPRRFLPTHGSGGDRLNVMPIISSCRHTRQKLAHIFIGAAVQAQAAQRSGSCSLYTSGLALDSMQALHSTLLPPSAIHHSLYLPNFTPSTIYPLPRPHTDAPEIKISGNLIVAGNEDIRVFEIRESLIARTDSLPITNGVNGYGTNGVNGVEDVGAMEEDFYDTGPSEVRSLCSMANTMHCLLLLISACAVAL